MADPDLAAAIKSALAAVEIPGGGDLAGYAGLSDIIVTPSAVAFAIAVAPGMEAAFGPAREQAAAAAQQLVGTRKVMVSLTGGKPPAKAGPNFSHGKPVLPGKTPVPGIKRIIAVGSGKGRRQIHHGGQSGVGTAGRWPPRRPSRCRSLRPLHPQTARARGPARHSRRRYLYPARRLWPQGHVDRLHAGQGSGGGLARPHGHLGAAPIAARDRLGRS